MGALLSRFIANFLSIEPSRILMLGLDNAGKTTILYKIKLDEAVTTVPTIGFNVEAVEPLKGVRFTVWDVGGQEKIRRLWHHYYAGSDGLIFVIDSNDRERISEAREELFGVLNDDTMRGLPFVVLANKQDLPHALTASEIVEKLQLSKLRNNWYVQATCATNGDGLFEGLKTMSDMIKQSRGKRY